MFADQKGGAGKPEDAMGHEETYLSRRNVGRSGKPGPFKMRAGKAKRAAKTRREEADAECVRGCLMDVTAGRAGLIWCHRAALKAESKHFTPLKEVGRAIIVCVRRGETCKSESNQVGCDHGVTGVPRVPLVLDPSHRLTRSKG